MSNRKIGICGDSFMSAVIYNESDLDNGYDKHFTDILSKKLNISLITFAKAGSSNQAIRLQISEIIKERPDFVIVGTTSPERVELPINDKSYEYNNGIFNIFYSNCPNTSTLHPKFKQIEPKMVSTTFYDIITGGFNMFYSKEQIKTFKLWFENFFDEKWKKQIDSWIISDGLQELQDNHIDFYCINSHLNEKNLERFGEKIIGYNSELNPWNYYNPNNNQKYWFHTGLEEQEILAEKWYDKIKDKDCLKTKFL